MKILVDENIPFITVGALRDTGHNVKDNRKRIHRRVMMAIQDIGPEEWPNLIVEMRDNVRSVWRLKK